MDVADDSGRWEAGSSDGSAAARCRCGDGAFVAVELQDEDGHVATATDRVVFVEVTGPGTLQALGSAADTDRAGVQRPHSAPITCQQLSEALSVRGGAGSCL
ncbi:hypothetical protein [Microlunatus panaciterrae]|uniref:hypothetical protein n=1 Tax=Microlunatus panaciterrae TaxID=400768 RepID=UPI00195D3A3C